MTEQMKLILLFICKIKIYQLTKLPYQKIAEQILETPPEQGYLTISNASQWRLQYQRIVALNDDIPGIDKIVSYNKPK